MSNLKGLSTAFNLYSTEDEGFLPHYRTTYGGRSYFTNKLAPYLDIDDSQWDFQAYGEISSGVWQCPTAKDRDMIVQSLTSGGGYGVNISHMIRDTYGYTPPLPHTSLDSVYQPGVKPG